MRFALDPDRHVLDDDVSELLVTCGGNQGRQDGRLSTPAWQEFSHITDDPCLLVDYNVMFREIMQNSGETREAQAMAEEAKQKCPGYDFRIPRNP